MADRRCPRRAGSWPRRRCIAVRRGFSLEFHAETDEWAGDLRTVTRAGLPSIGVVDRPAYVSAQGIELRRALTDPDANLHGIMPAATTDAVVVPFSAESAKRRRGLLLWL